MSEYFGRVYNITVSSPAGEIKVFDGFLDNPLQVQFQIDQTPASHLAYAEITVFGLSRESRKAIYERFNEITLVAGWREMYGTIFTGEIQNVEIGRTGADPFVRMYCRSAVSQWDGASVNEALAAGTSYKDIIRRVAESFELPIEFIGDFSDLSPAIKGKTLKGDSKALMNSLQNGTNPLPSFSWYIDSRGTLQVVRDGAGRDQPETYPYTPANGLIGTPEVRLDGVDIDVLMNPRIRPLDLYSVESETDSLTFNAVYYKPFEYPRTTGEGLNRVRALRHEGDYYGDVWQTSLEGIRV